MGARAECRAVTRAYGSKGGRKSGRLLADVGSSATAQSLAKGTGCGDRKTHDDCKDHADRRYGNPSAERVSSVYPIGRQTHNGLGRTPRPGSLISESDKKGRRVQEWGPLQLSPPRLHFGSSRPWPAFSRPDSTRRSTAQGGKGKGGAEGPAPSLSAGPL
jgi:hypothetical protein